MVCGRMGCLHSMLRPALHMSFLKGRSKAREFIIQCSCVNAIVCITRRAGFRPNEWIGTKSQRHVPQVWSHRFRVLRHGGLRSNLATPAAPAGDKYPTKIRNSGSQPLRPSPVCGPKIRGPILFGRAPPSITALHGSQKTDCGKAARRA